MSANGIAQQTIDLPQGQIRYREIGSGDPIVFVHGYLVDSRLWDGVAEALAPGHRCILPDWPMGAQKVALNPDADLSPPGVADLIAEFIRQKGLEGATIVANDSGGAMSQILAARHPDLVGRLVLTNCDIGKNFPPGPFKAMPPIAKLPGGIDVIAAPFRVGAIARAAFRPFTKRPVPAELVADWMAPAFADKEIKRDLRKVTVGMHRRYTLEAAEQLREFEKPVLLIWAKDDRVFSLDSAKWLAERLPDARIVEIDDARTFVSLDQPERVAEAIAEFA